MCWFVPADVNISLFEKWEKVNEQDLASRKEQMQQNKIAYKQEKKYILAVPYDEKDSWCLMGYRCQILVLQE